MGYHNARTLEALTDEELAALRTRAAAGDHDAIAQLVELAGEREDLDELRRLAASGNTDAADILAELTDVEDEAGQ